MSGHTQREMVALCGLPALLLSSLKASWLSIGALNYLSFLAIAVAYAGWGHPLQRYQAADVAPFALLTPCTGIVASRLILGEVFGPAGYAGMALILCGLAIIVLSRQRMRTLIPARRWRGYRD